MAYKTSTGKGIGGAPGKTTGRVSSSSSAPKIQYDTKTGAKLKSGQSTVVDGKSVKAGSAYTGVNAFGSNSTKINYDSKTGKMLSSGQKTTYAGKEVSQGDDIGQNLASAMAPQAPQQLAKPVVPSTAPNMAQTNPANQDTINFNSKDGSQLAPGASFVDSATGKTMKQGDKFQQAFQQTTATGTQAPADYGGAMSTIQGSMPKQEQTPTLLGGMMETDNNFDSIFTNLDKYFAPQEQKKSLLQEYKAMEKSLGINKINEELIDAKRIIEGTEDDIRSEITATGGMATDSQVLAMGNARNKSLIKNYNVLLETRDNAMQQLNTMMNLTIEDRKASEAEFDRKMGYAFKVAEFKERAQNNAKQTYMTLGDKMGWDTLFSSMSPYEQSIATKTMGISPMQAQQLSARSRQDRMFEQEKQRLTLDNMRLDNANIRSTIANRNSGGAGGGAGSNPSLMLPQLQSNVEQINGLASNKYLANAVGPNKYSRWGVRNLFTGGKSNFIAGVEQIRSQLNLDALIQAKSRGATFGALSDQELRVLSSSASKIGTWAKTDDKGKTIGYEASEKDFRNELDKINNFAKLDYVLKGGDASSVGVIIMPDKTVWSKNSDGSVVQLK